MELAMLHASNTQHKVCLNFYHLYCIYVSAGLLLKYEDSPPKPVMETFRDHIQFFHALFIWILISRFRYHFEFQTLNFELQNKNKIK
jgi:hypothetical protein